MFISTKEKERINFSIKDLHSRVETLGRSLNAVLDKLTTREAEELKLRPVAKVVTEKVRARRNAYARKYYARKRAEKAAEKVNSTKTK